MGYGEVFSKRFNELQETALQNSIKSHHEGIPFCEHFPLPCGFKMSCTHNSARENLNLNVSFSGNNCFSSREKDKKIPSGGLKGYEDF